MAQEFFLGIKLGVTGASAIGAALGSVQSSLKGLGDAARRLQSEQDRLGEAIRRHMGTLAPQTLAALNRDYERLGRTIEAVTRRQEALSRAMQRRADLAAERQRIGGEIMGAYATTLAVGAPVMGAVREAAGFGDAVKDIAIVGELTRDEERKLGASLRAVAREVNQTAADMARGVGMLIANGMEAKKAAEQAALLGRFTTATRASFDDAAKMMVSFDLLGVSAKDMELAFSQAAKAGKLGSFEVRDMAKWFPQLGGYLKAIGVTGNEAVVNMASRLQIAMKTAGSTDEAANNFRNFLAKLTSPDTAKDFEKLGIDLQGSMLRMARQGLDPIEGAVSVIMGQMAKTSPKVAAELQALSKEIAAIQDPAERAAELERRRAMIEALGASAGLGQMFQDMQAVGYLLAEIQNRDELQRIRAETASGRNADGQMSLDADFAKRMESPLEQFKRLKIEVQELGMSVGEALLPALLDIVQAIRPVVTGFAAWARENPALIKGAVGFALGLATVKAGVLSLGWLINFFVKSPAATLMTAWHSIGARILIARAAMAAGGTGLQAIAAAAGLSGGAVARLGALLVWFRGAATAALMAVGRAVLWLGRAVLLNPIGLVLTAIAGAAYLVWRNWDRIGPALGKAWAALKAGAAAALDGLKALPGRLLSIGQQLVQGLIDGIKAKLGAAGEAIKGLGQSVVSGLKNLLGIRSPSRVFAELGGFVGDGFAQGMGASMGAVHKAAMGLSAAAMIATPAVQARQPSVLPQVMPIVRQTVDPMVQPVALPQIADAPRAIRQTVEPVALPQIADATRTIRQTVEPVALPQIADATRTIRQTVEPVALPQIADATRTIRQTVEPVALPQIADATRTIRQTVEPVALPQIADATRTIRQTVEPVALPQIADATRTIRQTVEPVALPQIADATRTIRQTVEPVALPQIADATRTIRQTVEPVALPQIADVSDAVQTIRQATAQAAPAFGATKPGAGGTAGGMTITFAPVIHVAAGAQAGEVREAAQQAVQLSFAEFERLMRRYEAERKRIAP
ncbi:phage tail tape measure protein [Hydrogenophilus thermoluteolus]|uniref:Phage tail tape measure protein n=1 Tax=Hydrogenophilus thermoluteolus TaxID=297 RepID=A0A2Z6DXQ1_HYDTE|nr:phage tail tape measure protein [Hydrogenophilus thermoluteolus]BBD77243.1 phage tail tape measure protein [Hydrogenophilus thermoluteolus]